MKNEWLKHNLEGISLDLPETNPDTAKRNIELLVFPGIMSSIITQEINSRQKGILSAMRGMILKREIPLYFAPDDTTEESNKYERRIRSEEIDLKDNRKGIRIRVSDTAVRLLPAPDDRDLTARAIRSAMLSAFDSYMFLRPQGMFKAGPYQSNIK